MNRPVPAPDSLPEEASGAILGGANPLLGLSRRQLARATGRFVSASARHTPTVAGAGVHLAGELAAVAAGRSTVAPAPGDRRFADDAFTRNPLYRRAMQGYLASGAALDGLVDRVGLSGIDAVRARFALTLLTEALAPTNSLLGNPGALRRAKATRGRSLLRGVRNFAGDVAHNGGLPSMVDTRPFIKGVTVAASPGRVVFRNDVCELIQYAPTTPTVHRRPMVIIPPQVNRFWVLDLAPGRSMVEYLAAQGQQVFVLVWRNPSPEHRDWSLDTYIAAALEALDAASDVGRSLELNVVGVCAGGITTAALMGHLAAVGDRRVASLTLLVTVLDTDMESALTAFLTEPTGAAAIRHSRRKGVLAGREMARVFAWLRPNDLVWNYWVNNYLLGQEPPAFDVLAWNSEATNLPAGLHADFITIGLDNAFAQAGTLEVLGTPVDLGKVECDVYAVAAQTDHITPWPACYRSLRLLGGESRFVLSSSGHIQALVNPPGNPKARYSTNPDLPAEPEAWLAGATPESGTWWTDWAAWLDERGGGRVKTPRTLGSRRHPATDPAPGRYVFG
ncbi:MAG TPA: alpha/beta fold hydrolase [Acidimicrobiia bacterium]|nr:alpha/beta fold hydrolase [Acidimicrobiia bacterium]